MQIMSWRARLSRSLAKNSQRPDARYVTLATVRLDGTPAARTVVFRGFLGDSDDLTFVTDRRSHKVVEVAANPHCEVAWYFPITREQYRVRGTLTIVDEAHEDAALLAARQAAWARMSEPGRQQFVWPHPGLPRIPEQEEDFLVPSPDSAQPAVTSFCLVVLRVSQVDHLSLKANQRTLFARTAAAGDAGAAQETGEWQAQDVNP